MTPRDADPLRPPDTDRDEPPEARRARTVLALLAGIAALLLLYIVFEATRPIA